MANSLVIGDDAAILGWLFSTFKMAPVPVNRAIGVLGPDKTLVGAFTFHNFNGVNIELGYYGSRTLSAGIVRSIAKIALIEFNPARCTVIVSKRNKRLIRSIGKFGFRLEGVQRRYLGHEDVNRNTGVRFVLFREQIDRLAGVTGGLKQSQG